MKKNKVKSTKHSSNARNIDRANLEASLKDEANGFYHFESDLKKFMEGKGN